MTKQSIKLIVSSLIIIIMFGFIKNLFAQTDNMALSKAIKDGAYLVDVRTPSEFAAGSVAGAVNIPLDKVAAQLAKFKDKRSIVVFCRSGARSTQAKNLLEQNGIKNIINGGSWQNVNQAAADSSKAKQ